MPAAIASSDQIVITASRSPEDEASTPASVTILDKDRLGRLDQPLVPALLRLAPSTAVASSGPAGSLAEVRIRGAESNHTLLFVDGIRANDPASGNIPRFELLNADIASRIEIVRGPQSALWGSEAIGGVIAVNGTDDQRGYSAKAEAGAFGLTRGAVAGALAFGPASVSGAVALQRARGIDSFGAPGGDKDGYRNLAARVRGTVRLAPQLEIGASGFALAGRSEFDGYDLFTFAHEDTLDSSRNRLAAGRLWVAYGDANSPWAARASASLLASSNRNLLGRDPINRTRGTRRVVDAQLERQLRTGSVRHRLIAAVEDERETFHARDVIYGGLSDQDRARSHQALTLEWRAEAKRLTADVALRRDRFATFKDATAVRASLLGKIGHGFAIAGSYSEGIAQPTFFDLYGFFPGNFIGNPALKPESSKGWEASLRFRRKTVDGALTLYRQRLHDEIVDTFDPRTFVQSAANRATASRRFGVEAEIGWSPSAALRLSANYALLDATEPDPTEAGQLRELRRPRHSGAIVADGRSGRWSYGASLAFVGTRRDRRDNAPYDIVALHSYVLADARIAYAPRRGLELFVRGANLLDQDYQEVAGYRTEGRGIYLGLSLGSPR